MNTQIKGVLKIEAGDLTQTVKILALAVKIAARMHIESYDRLAAEKALHDEERRVTKNRADASISRFDVAAFTPIIDFNRFYKIGVYEACRSTVWWLGNDELERPLASMLLNNWNESNEWADGLLSMYGIDMNLVPHPFA